MKRNQARVARAHARVHGHVHQPPPRRGSPALDLERLPGAGGLQKIAIRNHSEVSLLCSALYAKCIHCVGLYMQSVFIMSCFICKVSLLCRALYAKCPYCVGLYMQSVLIM